MLYRHTFLTLLILGLFCSKNFVYANNYQTIIIGGEVHLKGALTEGACSISTDSRDMHIDMGHYTSHMFDRVGSFATNSIPFTIKLTGCKPELTEFVGITFSGMTDPKEPDVFLVTSSDGGPVGISGSDRFSGLGLMINDTDGHQVLPGEQPAIFHQPDSSDVELHYLARYRATSRDIYPGPLHSEVWFGIAYP